MFLRLRPTIFTPPIFAPLNFLTGAPLAQLAQRGKCAIETVTIVQSTGAPAYGRMRHWVLLMAHPWRMLVLWTTQSPRPDGAPGIFYGTGRIYIISVRAGRLV